MNVKDVTLETLAEHLNLSRYSVSRALSGKDGVSETTRQAVLNLAHELGYQHPALVRGGQVNKGNNVMLLIPQDVEYGGAFWLSVLGGAEEEAERLGFNLITRPLSNDKQYAKVLRHRKIHGLIGIGYRSRELIDTFLGSGIPITLITHPNPLEKVDTVTSRNWEGGYAVGRHLLELGHKRLLFVSDTSGHPTQKERFRGLSEAIKEHPDVTSDEIQVPLENQSALFEESYAATLSSGKEATAVFCALDTFALNVIWALQRLKLNVPYDVSVVGYSDSPEATQFEPKLTTVRSPTRQLGIAAMQNLYRQIQSNGVAGSPRHLALSPELVVRDSTGPAW